MSEIPNNSGRVLPDLSRPSTAQPDAQRYANMTQAELIQALLDAKSNETRSKKAHFKVTDKGCCSLYHGARFPTSLYRQQWAVVIAAIEDGSLQAFIKANITKLLLKGKEVG